MVLLVNNLDQIKSVRFINPVVINGFVIVWGLVFIFLFEFVIF